MLNIIYIKAVKENFEDFYKLRCDSDNIKWTGWIEAPDKFKLLSWYNTQLSNKPRDIYLFYNSNDIVGYLYLDKLDDSVGLSYGVSSSHSGKGIGSKIIQTAIDISKNEKFKIITAWVSEENTKSMRILEKNGFKMTSEFSFRKLPLVNAVDKFYLWSICL